ncbi:MAG: hypothetical protein IKO44_02515 [Ruminococcus sp.]|nr:hypothetical protein [Ruminococcus sp.]
MNIIQQAGINKRSFELNYNGGTIWCEHLDGMGAYENEVIKKFLGDKPSFSRPSVSSSMIVNLDKTEMTDRIAETIVSALTDSKKKIRKIAFVGVDKRWHKKLKKIQDSGCIIKFLTDYEKAKEWVI